jgi:outer membrane protein OmpA-like peptidoglycan-associated protein/flagellar hook assembly protein FlgD
MNMKKRLLSGAGIVAVLVVALLGCQTAKPALVAPADSAIEVEKSGFSPAGAAGQNTIDISVLFGNGDAIKSWKVELTGSAAVQKTWSGDAKYLPASLNWDGKQDSGTMAADGTYTAKLSVDYASTYQSVSVESKSFVLDINPPTGSITMDPAKFTPTDIGVQGPVTLTVNAKSALAHMDSWSLDVLDSAGGLVKNWSGQWPNTTAAWDGSLMNGGTVTPGATYQATATVRDEYGNSSRLKAEITVATLPEKAPVVAEKPAPPPPPPPPPAKPGQPAIAAQSAGFSPNGDAVSDSLTLALGYGQPSAVVSWKVTISSRESGTQKTFSGDGSSLPASVTWDGKSDGGVLSPDGVYTATIAVGYGTAFAAGSAHSQSFVLDVTPPTGTISLSSELFSPIESSDTISLKLTASSPLAKIDSWTMDIFDPGGNVFRSFTKKWPSDTAVWDGRNAAGEMVQSAEDYPVVARIRDQFGNVGTAKAMVPIDILVEKNATGYRILASRIFFKGFTADYKDVPADLSAQNLARLDALAAKLKKFPEYKIRMIGHAVMINWDNPAAGSEEQSKILIPLSKARADAVKAALVERGIDGARLTTEGVGASDQLVPDSNYKDRWQNRRVALFLEKE